MVRNVRVGDFTIASHEQGVGDPVLLVHSGGFSSRQWKRLVALLAPTHHVLAPDLLGYGESSPWPADRPFHFSRDLDALAAVLAGLPPAHVVGHSYGGFLALMLALRDPPAVRSLALYDPVAFGILDEPADAEARAALYLPAPTYTGVPWLAAFVDWWNGPGAWQHLAPEAQAAFVAAGPKLYGEVMSLTADTTDRAGYAKISQPTLLFGGERTTTTEHRVVEKLGRTLPNVEVHWVEGAGHMGPITHGAIVNAAIAAHIRAH